MRLHWKRSQTYTAMGRLHHYSIHGDEGGPWKVDAAEDGWDKIGPPVRIGEAGTLDEAFTVAEQHNQKGRG